MARTVKKVKTVRNVRDVKKVRTAAARKTSKLVIRSSQWYGWVPDLPDHRDHIYAAPIAAAIPLPPIVDLRSGCPPVYDQGQLGSCTANAIGAALQFNQMKQGFADVFAPSRLFIYYNERVIEGTVKADAGAMIRDGMKSVAKQGAPHEALWPYVISKFSTKPSAAAYKDAAKHPAVLYQRVIQDLAQLKGCLAAGFPIVFGFSVYDSFESSAVAKSGNAPMPNPTEKLLGGHAVLAVGYDDTNKWFVVRNSWGTGWGMKGYFTLPYDYLTDPNLADDFWTVKAVQ
jgi:C1A family cysteine protease